MTNDVPTLSEIQASIAAAYAEPVARLRDQLKAVDARERLILADLEQTRAVKRELVSGLRKLDPTMPRPGKKTAGSNGGGAYKKEQRQRQAVAAAKKAIDTLAADKPDGFTRTAVQSEMKADGFAIGDARMGVVMDELHQSGYLTLHKLVTGGNKAYRRTEDLSNGSPRQAD